VGDDPALEALAQRIAPTESVANIAFVDVATRELPAFGLEDPTDGSRPSS
jgi:hypothetical protein